MAIKVLASFRRIRQWQINSALIIWRLADMILRVDTIGTVFTLIDMWLTALPRHIIVTTSRLLLLSWKMASKLSNRNTQTMLATLPRHRHTINLLLPSLTLIKTSIRSLYTLTALTRVPTLQSPQSLRTYSLSVEIQRKHMIIICLQKISVLEQLRPHASVIMGKCTIRLNPLSFNQHNIMLFHLIRHTSTPHSINERAVSLKDLALVVRIQGNMKKTFFATISNFLRTIMIMSAERTNIMHRLMMAF
mmetsp:Transcript_16964/g.26515  ORF Transcript_16964/g.26515 Transcript_16964/m.26515 type:complete len:248 (+) Transcript_16964:1792-2535(+)